MTQQRRLASGPDRLVLSLFTGAGGLDLGLEAAGFSVSICVEVDEDARRTLMANRSSWKLAKPEDIHRIEPDELLAQADLRRGDVALLTGGPPCQPFSKSANWSNGGIRGLRDPRASTLHAYLKVVEAALPRVLILENVKGLASNHKDEGGWQLFRDEIRTINRRQGTEYDPQVIHLDAADYGVPQIRERVFILASIDGRKFKVPPPTHGEGDSLEPCRTAWDAIGDLDKEDWPLELEVIGKWAGLLKSIPEGKNYLWHTPRGGGEPLFGWRTRYWSFLIVILIAGVTTNLVEQNRNRLETHLRAAAPEWAWLMLTNPRLRDQHQIEGLAQEWRSEYYDDHDRRTLFISVMKNHSHLRNLAALLSRVDLSDVPAIIFDDEADQASLNTRPNDSVASSTYRNIAALRQALPRHTYLQSAATPQAPLLITRIDSLSADFAELVSPGEGYTGGQEFFGTRSSHVEIIPQSEIYRDGQLPLEPPQSLLRAMMVFFIGVAAGRLEAMQTHRSMLIHPSKATATHRQYLDWANGLMAHWHSVLLAAGEPGRQELLAEFREAHAGLARTCDTLPPFEQIQTRLPVAINQTAVTLVNSVDGREVPWPNSPSHILVGGEKLGRGYTVKGLTVTYMPRSPGGWTADTIQQRARFFGYHNEYIGYCRVYLHADVRDAYVAYVRHEQDMRGRLEDHHGHPLREWRRLFYLDRRLAPTRRNVLSSPYFRPRFPEGWFAPRAPHLSPLDGRQNQEIVSRLESLDFEVHRDHPQHHYAVAYLRDVFEQVLVPLSYLDEKDALGLCVVNCNLATLLEREEDARCLVYLMRRGRLRNRTFKGGEIETLHQGRSSAGAESYPGDRAFSDGNLPTVQLHMLRVRDLDRARVFENVPAVAVRLHQQEDMLVHDE